MRILRLTLPVLILLGAARAETGLAFLKIAADAASAGMGEAVVGSWQSALSPVGNPALAPSDDQWHLSLSRADWYFDSEFIAIGFRMPLRTWSAGADIRVLSSEDFPLRVDSNPDPLGSYRLDDLAIGVHVSAPLGERLRLGAAIRRIQESIYLEDSRGWAADLGLRWEKDGRTEPGRPALAFSAGARNLGYSSEFVNEAPDLPRLLSLGAELRRTIATAPVALQAEFRHLQDDGGHLHLGALAAPLSGLALRAGWMSGYEERGATLGLGFAWRGMKLDYSYLPHSKLEDVHRFTFSFAL